MGLTMFAQQKLNPPPPDPAGSSDDVVTIGDDGVLFAAATYWLTNNVLSFAQQAYIMKALAQRGR